MKEDVKKIHLNEASQVMLYGDTPEDMNAIAQIFKKRRSNSSSTS